MPAAIHPPRLQQGSTTALFQGKRLHRQRQDASVPGSWRGTLKYHSAALATILSNLHCSMPAMLVAEKQRDADHVHSTSRHLLCIMPKHIQETLAMYSATKDQSLLCASACCAALPVGLLCIIYTQEVAATAPQQVKVRSRQHMQHSTTLTSFEHVTGTNMWKVLCNLCHLLHRCIASTRRSSIVTHAPVWRLAEPASTPKMLQHQHDGF